MSKLMFRIVFIALFIFGGILSVSAATIISTETGGYWNNPSTWVGGVLPGEEDDVVINSDVIFHTGTVNISSLLISETGDLSHKSAAGLYTNPYLALIVTGDVINNGDIKQTYSYFFSTYFSNGSYRYGYLNIIVGGDLTNNGNIYYYNDKNIDRLKLYGNIENNGTIQGVTSLNWDSFLNVNSYEFTLTNEATEVISGTSKKLPNDYFNTVENLYWSVKGINTDTSVTTLTDEKCINVKGCIGGIPAPINLTQSYILPEIGTEETIEPGESLGKFQSGSGILLKSFIPSLDKSDLTYMVDVDFLDTGVSKSYTGSITEDGDGIITIKNFPKGDYSWSARVINDNGIQSDTAQFLVATTINPDFSIYEGFEPYPHGYNFPNSSPNPDILDGGILFSTGAILGKEFDFRIKIGGTKWDIFNITSPEESFNDKRQMFNAFESVGLNEDIPTILSGGSCVGLGLTAGAYYLDNTFFTELYSATGGDNLWNSINLDWNNFDDTLKIILATHLSQKLNIYQDVEKESRDNQSEMDILKEIRDYPQNRYLLTFAGARDDKSSLFGHAVVPYKVEGNRIYVWDNNVPYSNLQNNTNSYGGYEQFIEINSNGFYSEYYDEVFEWEHFQDLAIININELSNIGSTSVVGFNNTDTLYTFSGKGDIQIIDDQGRITGFQNGLIVKEIPGTEVLIPYNATIEGLNQENIWKQIYLPQKQDNLTIQISGKADEEYDLMIAGGDYYTKLEGVSTSSGEIDTFTTTANNLKIDFDDSKTGDYNLLVDNFQNSGTGTIYIDSVDVISDTQEYTIDWEKVVTNTDDALTYETDTDNDGVYDTSVSTGPIIPGEELLEDNDENNEEEEQVQESDYVFQSKNISYNSGQQTAISSYYTIVTNFPGFNWGEDIEFTTSGEGNPTIQTSSSGRQSEGVFKGGVNIRMDVPPVGESYTAYLHIPGYTLEFTTSRDAPPPNDVGTLDFGTKTVNYGGTATSSWLNFPFLFEPTEFTLTGEGNPTAQTNNGQRANSGTVRWGTNIKAEIPESGETRIIEFEILGQTGTFTIIRE